MNKEKRNNKCKDCGNFLEDKRCNYCPQCDWDRFIQKFSINTITAKCERCGKYHTYSLGNWNGREKTKCPKCKKPLSVCPSGGFRFSKVI